MLKRTALLALILALAVSPALAEFDTAALENPAELTEYLDDNGVDTVWRPVEQPFFGSASEGTVCAFLDYMELANEELLVLRFTVTVEVDELLYAGSLTVQVGKETWTFPVHAATTEYDMVYQEDYPVLLGTDGLEMVKAMSKNKGGEVRFTLSGEREVSGALAIPADQVKAIWKRYTDRRWDRQDFSALSPET